MQVLVVLIYFQYLKCFKKLLFLCCVLSVNWFNVLESVVSSAYIMKLLWEIINIYIVNNNDPKIDPCGTPIFTGKVSDCISSISTYFRRLLK